MFFEENMTATNKTCGEEDGNVINRRTMKQ